MNRGLWIARKNYLFTLMRRVSDGHGGDDVEFFKQHYDEVVKQYPDEAIEEAICCYQEMVEQLKYYSRGKR